MKLSEILEEIAEKYPHGLTDDSVIRKINLIQNELFRTYNRVRTMAIYHLKKDTFAYALPFPQSNLLDVVVEGTEYLYQDSKKVSNTPFYYFVGTSGLGLYPTPDKDVTNGLSLFYYRYPKQLTAEDLTVDPELDQDFHMLLVYGALVQITEAFADVAMVNNFTGKYNSVLEQYMKVNTETPDYQIIEDIWGVW